MKRIFVTMVAVGLAAGAALSACGEAAQGETTGDQPTASATTASADVPNGLIVCEMPNYDGQQGLTQTQIFAIVDGQAKRYSEFQNTAFDLCESGQQGCSLEIADGAIRMEYTAPNGTRSRYDVALDEMQIVARETAPGEEERVVALDGATQCTREPLPVGMKIN